MRPLLSVLALAACISCVSPRDAERGEIVVAELPSPAEVGSGEPFLSSGEDAVHMSWWERTAEGGQALRVATLKADGWGVPATVAQGEDFFVNWADFPAVSTGNDGRLWAHWLQRTEGPGLAYAIRVASSADGGTTWSEPWTPHEDGTPTEHGFVSLFPWGDGVGMTWLDGRKYAPGPQGEEASMEMTVRFRAAGGEGGPGPEVLVDPRACDCCQTDVALTEEGPVLVYRNRTEDEVRDIYMARWNEGGWQEGVPVHDDGWVIAGCPVNGPAVDARGQSVVVVWFTAADDVAQVKAAFSDDGGRTFSQPLRVDDGNPAGRVDVRMLDDGTALASWLERTGGDQAQVRVATISPQEGRSAMWVVSTSSSARSSGFPRMARLPWDPSSALLAWTDVSDPENSVVRLMKLELP